MIISCSRRTDIPGLYPDWLINRLRAGFCTVVNPLNPKQISRVALNVASVDAIVFWTKNSAPLHTHIPEIVSRGYKFYFQFTITGYSEAIEKNTPRIETAIEAFQALSQHIGPERVIWRYDPIILSKRLTQSYHIESFRKIARALAGYTRRVVVSIVDFPRRTMKNLGTSARLAKESLLVGELDCLIAALAKVARDSDLEIQSCAETFDFSNHGIRHGKCIDDDLLAKVFGIRVSDRKDSSQRDECACVKSRDIGFYDSCTHGCIYCYATDLMKANALRTLHNPLSPSLIGWHEVPDRNTQLELKIDPAHE